MVLNRRKDTRKPIMSVQFGRWNVEGPAPAADYIEKVRTMLAPYGPDSDESYSKDGMKSLYRAFCTTKESWRETQPHVCTSGTVITWDGRLDNRAELLSSLRPSLAINSAKSTNSPTLKHEEWDTQTDVEIVAAAYEKWGAACLGKFIGDWALSIWNPHEHSVLLAKDPIGTKQLYYSFEKDHITWSTILDPLVLDAGHPFQICEEYIAGWFSLLPAAHLTPYVGIHAVPPSSSVLLQPRNHGVKHIVTKYWDFDPDRKIRYRTDAEYEEHFRTVFANAVQRRLRSDRPVLAELSGGMDSSSIVCVGDLVLAQAQGRNITPHLRITSSSDLTPRLDTISWFDDSDPASHEERSYFTKVEQKRGRTGYHIDLDRKKQMGKTEVDSTKSFFSEFEGDRLAVTPDFNRTWLISEHYTAHMRSQGYRVTLSGVGGEDPTGGYVPTPRPELQNLLARARFFTLVRQLNAWAAKMRKPRLPLLWEAVRGFFTHSLTATGALEDMRPVPWFDPGFVRRNRAALRGYSSRVKFFGTLPSFQDHIHGFNHLQRLLAYLGGLRYYLEALREVRYPYLDREMLEFAYGIPKEQLVRVGQRRSLMKRALASIVPDELLKRKPRAAITHDPNKDASTEWPSLAEMGEHIISPVGILDPNRFLEALQKARRKEEVPIDSLVKTLTLESWLRHLTTQGVLASSMSTKKPDYFFVS